MTCRGTLIKKITGYKAQKNINKEISKKYRKEKYFSPPLNRAQIQKYSKVKVSITNYCCKFM